MERERRGRYTARRALRTPPPRKANILLRCILSGLVLILFLSGAGVASGVVFVKNVKLPPLSFAHALNFENTQILASNRKLLYDLPDPIGNRIIRPLELNPNNPKRCPHGRFTHHLPKYYTCSGDGIPLMLRDATIATEDPTFYSNPGFDPLSMLRATYQDLTSGQIQSGASTITQQFVKQYVLKNKGQTLTRKFKEIILAWQMTQKYPKDFILYYYLNSVYYGDLAYGVEAAAEAYFHVGVPHLQLWQDAMLAGMPQSPSDYNPFNNPRTTGQWYSRMLEVLNYMLERGYISHRQEIQAEQQAQSYTFHQQTSHMKQSQFVLYAIDQFQQMTNPTSRSYDRYLAQQLARHHKRGLYDGLRIVTTLKPGLQATAEQTVHNQVASLGYQNVTDGALVSINTQQSCYGCIMAMVGTAHVDRGSSQINMADQPRQPGSSFKVFNYVSAFAKGLSPASIVDDAPISIPVTGGQPYAPTNYDQTYHGAVTLRTALANSLNVPAVKVELFNGVSRVAQTAHRFGITDLWHDNPTCCQYALTLGGLERGVKLIQETAAYGAFSTEGIKVPPISIKKIIDRSNGKVIWKASSDPVLRGERVRVASAADTYLVTSILSDDNARTMEFGYNSPLQLNRLDATGQETAAAKTGTTNAFTDNWTVGYTPQMVTGVWVGNANYTPMINSTGITGAAPIWHDFMLQAFSELHLPVVGFATPPGVTKGTECQLANEPAGSFSSFGLDYVTTSITPYCSVPTTALDPGTTPTYGYTPVPTQPQTNPLVYPTPTAPVITNPGTGNTGTTQPGTGTGNSPPVLLGGNH